MVGGQQGLTLALKKLGPKEGQDLLKSLTNQRLRPPHPQVTPHRGDKGQAGAST